MNDQGTVEMVLHTNRSVVIARLLLAAALIVGLFYWMQWRYPTSFRIGWGLTVVLFAFVLYLPVRLLVTGKAIIVTTRGLIDRTSGLGFVAWSEIRGAKVQPYMGLNLVALDLTDQEAVLARLPFLRRGIWRWYHRKHTGGPTLAASFVEGGADVVTRIVNGRATGAPTQGAV